MVAPVTQPTSARALHAPPLREGHLALIHGGQFHGLFNPPAGELALLTLGSND